MQPPCNGHCTDGDRGRAHESWRTRDHLVRSRSSAAAEMQSKLWALAPGVAEVGRHGVTDENTSRSLRFATFSVSRRRGIGAKQSNSEHLDPTSRRTAYFWSLAAASQSCAAGCPVMFH